ncbi:hypothetical protein BTR14_17260 [Rhizobium rhizosphaerae]|uniref:Uncharacterized protein n=1 Tax=Xaviernesmea rhizosphaerae TaxID=1672749 RepID=A0ABX3P9L9_9HYPH|nr:hypothetical protein [Xaviernesmea rhizosphaerae]OQP85128.1 hypothetical protein BTR14_17260 [Xaviernesmea rhizosphaerae]
MTEEKNWYASRTVWGGIVAILASLAHLAGYTLEADDQLGLVDGLSTLAGAAGGILALYGRVRARHRLV